ncbi:MAG: hypothetical protein NTX05_04750 [Fusobacteria bacterium]|nr:hypothetical protein [Fusobacteriota bacterium]
MRKKQLIIISIIMLSIGIYGANGGATTISGSSELTYTPVKPKTTNLVKECSVAGITPSSKIKTFESSMPTFVKISKLGTVQSKSVVSTLKSERLPTLRTNLTVKEQKSVVPEYFAINQGIILYEEKKYPEATTTFEGILKGMSSSDLLKSYVEYYLAKSYFQNGEYIRAIEWAKRTNDSPYEMKEVISLSYQKLNRNEMSEKCDRELFINGYRSSASTYEKRALQRLSKDSIYYQNVVSVMYEENFSALSTLTTPDLQKISNYFIGISDNKSALAVDNELLKRDNERYIQEQKLYLLYSLKQYVAAEKYGLELLKRESSNSVNYYIGLSNQRQGNLAKATEYIEKLQGGSVEREKTQLLGRYAYLQKNYDQVWGKA